MPVEIIDSGTLAKIKEKDGSQWRKYRDELFVPILCKPLSDEDMKNLAGYQWYGKTDVSDTTIKEIKENFARCTESVKKYLECDTVDEDPTCIVIAGHLGKTVSEFLQLKNHMQGFCFERWQCAQGMKPLMGVIDGTFGTDPDQLSRVFIHNLTHWYIYNQFCARIQSREKKEAQIYDEKLALMAERDLLCLVLQDCQGDQVCETLGKPLFSERADCLKKSELIKELKKLGCK